MQKSHLQRHKESLHKAKSIGRSGEKGKGRQSLDKDNIIFDTPMQIEARLPTVYFQTLIKPAIEAKQEARRADWLPGKDGTC